MGFIILLANANVFMRYVVGKPWGWVEEVTIFIFVWLIMFGAAAVTMAEGHCSIDVLARKLPPGPRRIMDIFTHLLVIITLCLMIWFGAKLTLSAGGKLTPMLGIPYSYIDAAIPVGCTIMLINYAQLLWWSITGKNQDQEESE
jgi:TRAP-type C4-dicarboxylate transport system permease small subunit